MTDEDSATPTRRRFRLTTEHKSSYGTVRRPSTFAYVLSTVLSVVIVNAGGR